jgi:hypothetical protein
MRTVLLISAPIALITTLATFGPLTSGLGLMLVLSWFVMPTGDTTGWLTTPWMGSHGCQAPRGYVLSSLVFSLLAAGVRSSFWLMIAPIPAFSSSACCRIVPAHRSSDHPTRNHGLGQISPLSRSSVAFLTSWPRAA